MDGAPGSSTGLRPWLERKLAPPGQKTNEGKS